MDEVFDKVLDVPNLVNIQDKIEYLLNLNCLN